MKISQPGFGPAAELVAWRVPKSAPVVVEQKDPKPLRPSLASFDAGGATEGECPNSLRSNKGHQHNAPSPPGQSAGLGIRKKRGKEGGKKSYRNFLKSLLMGS